MAYIVPKPLDFKNYFTRDFPYASDPQCVEGAVTDNDINKAINEALFNFNQDLFSNQQNFTIAFLYLTAHYLVTDLRNSSQGIGGQYNWLVGSKGVGSVNESYTIPQYILDHPYLAMLSKSTYGAKYLSLVLPQLTGQIFISAGDTQP